MPKIAFLGAGSIGFGRRLIGDIVSFPELADSSVHLMDPNEERLEFIRAAAGKMVEANGLPTRIEASTLADPITAGIPAGIAVSRIKKVAAAVTEDIYQIVHIPAREFWSKR